MSEPRELVERLYAAIQAKDAAALGAVVDEAFAPDAVMRLPGSLLYGGTHEGAETIRAMLVGLVSMERPIVVPDEIEVVRIVDQGDDVVAEVDFPWLAPGADAPIPMSAVEWFAFRDGRIVEMKVVYRDTVACAEAAAAARR